MLRDPYADRHGRVPALVSAVCVWCDADTHAAPEHVSDAACGECSRRTHGVRLLSKDERRALPRGARLDWTTTGVVDIARREDPSPAAPRYEVLIGAQVATDEQVPTAARRFAALAETHGWTVELVYALALDRRGDGTREVASLSVRCRRGGRRLVALWVNGTHVSLAGITAARLRQEIMAAE